MLGDSKSTRVKIALFTKQRALGCVESFLEGLGINWARYGEPPSLGSSGIDNVEVLLFSTCERPTYDNLSFFDLSIGLDETFGDAVAVVAQLRILNLPDRRSPGKAIALVVPYSVEHFHRHRRWSLSQPDTATLRTHLRLACQQRKEAGVLPDTLYAMTTNLDDVAAKVAASILNPRTRTIVPSLDAFPLPNARKSQESPAFDNMPAPSQATTQETDAAAASPDVPSPRQNLEVASAAKRKADALSHGTSKRARSTPQPQQNTEEISSSDVVQPQPNTQEMSSGDVVQTDDSSMIPDSAVKAHATHQEAAKDDQQPPNAEPDPNVIQLEQNLERLQRKSANQQSMIDTLHRSLAVYEPQHQQLFRENQRLLVRLAETEKLQAAVERLSETNTAQKAELKRAKEEANSVQRLLAGSETPDLQELGTLREKAKKVDSLEQRLHTHARDLDYMRTHYQTASSAAAEAHERAAVAEAQNESLRSRFEKAEKQERAKLNEVFSATKDMQAQSEVRKLRAQLRTQGQLLTIVTAQRNKFKEENDSLKDRLGVGLHTRASSVRANSAQPAVHGQAGSGTGAAGASAGKGADRPRASHELLKAAAGIQSASGAPSRNGSRAGSRQGSRAASPGANAARKGGNPMARGSTLKPS